MLRPITVFGLLLAAICLFSFQQTNGWMGKWTGERPEGITYTITVKDKYKGMNLCVVHAEGIQTFYTLDCWATGTPTTLKVYYRSATDGAFYANDRVNPNEPLFILTRTRGKVLWKWQQIFTDNLVMHKG